MQSDAEYETENSESQWLSGHLNFKFLFHIPRYT